MPSATLRFKLPEEREEFDTAVRAGAMATAIWETGQEVFRPARKHGYSDPTIAALLEKCGDFGTELVSALEQKFYEILRENNALGEE